jgi:hypothetical protein
LSYHAGELHFNWKTQFLKLVIERKIGSAQDIDWHEFLAKFPNQTVDSMSWCLKDIARQGNLNQPFYQRVIDLLPKLKLATERSSAVKHREDIVFLYDKVRGIN